MLMKQPLMIQKEEMLHIHVCIDYNINSIYLGFTSNVVINKKAKKNKSTKLWKYQEKRIPKSPGDTFCQINVFTKYIHAIWMQDTICRSCLPAITRRKKLDKWQYVFCCLFFATFCKSRCSTYSVCLLFYNCVQLNNAYLFLYRLIVV